MVRSKRWWSATITTITLSVMSTLDSNMKTLPSKLATPSTHAGMQRDQSTVNFHRSPTFERLVAGSIQEKAACVEDFAISFTGKNPAQI